METNFNINRERSNENITLKNCAGNYGLRFEEITRDLKIQHDEQMKTTRKSRQKSFLDKVNEDKADVAHFKIEKTEKRLQTIERELLKKTLK
ncbi:MAG TPA: hypothetical protein VK120_05340 [Sporosarcina sp.]|nr:hypothetical protein [Sporosarcina sp.]